MGYNWGVLGAPWGHHGGHGGHGGHRDQRVVMGESWGCQGGPADDMVEIYCLYIRSVAEQSSVVWSSSITSGEEYDLERVQKVALRIILKENYINYSNALFISSLQTLKSRRSILSRNFAIKCTKNDRTKDMFPVKVQTVNTRNPEKYAVTKARTSRLALSAIPTMQKQLNAHAQKKKV